MMNSSRQVEVIRGCSLGLALVLCLAPPADAQERGQRSHREHRRSSGRTREGHDLRRRVWTEIRSTLNGSEWRRFLRLSRDEKRRFIQKRQQDLTRKHRRDRERRYLAQLDSKQRKEIESLPEGQRSRALLALRLDAQMKRLIQTARARSLLDDDRAAAMQAERDLKQRAELVLDLQKTLFLNTFQTAFAAMPKARRERLESLPAREFFRQGEIRHLPVIHFFDQRRIHRSLRGDDALRGDLRQAQKTGQIPPRLRGLFRKGRLAEFLALSLEDRKSTLRHLGEAMRRARPPHSEKGRRAPGTRRGQGSLLLKHLIRRFQGLPEDERRRLGELPISRAIERLFPEHQRVRQRRSRF